LSYLLADYFFIHPKLHFNLLSATIADWIRMLSFFAVGSTFNFFGWLMRRAQADALGQRARAEEQLARLQEEMARRLAAEQARASSELQFKTMFDLTGSGIAQVDPATKRFVRVNPRLCQMTGYSESELLQRTVFDLTYSEDRSKDEATYAKVLKGDSEEYRAEKRYVRKDGAIFWVSVTANVIRDSRGQPMASLGIINDITERKMRTDQLERIVAERTAALRESNADLETFSYSISHDLRAPLRAMQGFSQILFEELRGKLDPHHLQYLRRIMASANRMDNLISDVLAYTRIVRSDLALVPVDLDQLVRDIIQTYPHLRAEKVDLQIEGPLHPVLGNEAALTQCISNLLGNAVKFVPIGKRPVVRVRSEIRDRDVLLWVEDNGIGIAPEHQGRIFEMFNRLQDQYEGTGIGLTIVRKAR
jgi:PAS domain S-box-containing protein